MIVAKLQDVEQQLLHATQVVQLHVRLADAHKSSKNATDGDFDGETEILELIDRVQRAERDLQNVTTQLLALAKYAETLEAWRRIVEVDALDANRQFLDLLNEGKIEKESAEAFSKATSFAVSVLTSYQAMSQKPSWLMQLVEDLTNIENAAKQSKFAKVLAPKCDEAETHGDTELKVLEKYLMVAKEVSLAVECTNHDGDDVFGNLDSAVVEMWSEAVKKLSKRATQKFRKLVVSGGLNEDFIARFCHATTLAVSLSTSAKGINKCKKKEQNRWRMWAIKQLAAIHEISLQPAFPHALHSLRHDCDTLIRHCDGDIANSLKELAASTRTTQWDTLQIDAKRKKIHQFGEKLRETCIFIIVRDKVCDIEPWSDTQWEDFSAIGQTLAVLVKSSFYRDEIAKSFKLLHSILEQFHDKIPDRSLTALLEPREDQSDPNDQAKRIATEFREREDDFDGEMKKFMEMVASLPSFEGVNLTATSLNKIQRVFTKVVDITSRFSKVILRTEASIAAFGEATKVTVDLICRISCGFIPRTKLKHWLARLRSVKHSSREHFSNSPATIVIEESVNQLEKYWNENYLDPFVAIRGVVDSTDVQGMDSIRLQKAALQLIGHFIHPCNTAWGELCQGVSISRENELRAKFLEFGGVLNDWLQRILDTGDQLPGFIKQLTPRLVRIDTKLPNTLPATLLENLQRIQKSKQK
eukprot:jgi/Phyca11/563402/estExt2_Genewise1.C_PHYCAscaffold_120103